MSIRISDRPKRLATWIVADCSLPDMEGVLERFVRLFRLCNEYSTRKRSRITRGQKISNFGILFLDTLNQRLADGDDALVVICCHGERDDEGQVSFFFGGAENPFTQSMHAALAPLFGCAARHAARGGRLVVVVDCCNMLSMPMGQGLVSENGVLVSSSAVAVDAEHKVPYGRMLGRFVDGLESIADDKTRQGDAFLSLAELEQVLECQYLVHGRKISPEKIGFRDSRQDLPDIDFSSLYRKDDAVEIFSGMDPTNGRVLLVGDAGSGRTMLAEGFAKAWVEQRKNSRISVMLDASKLVSLGNAEFAKRVMIEIVRKVLHSSFVGDGLLRRLTSLLVGCLGEAGEDDDWGHLRNTLGILLSSDTDSEVLVVLDNANLLYSGDEDEIRSRTGLLAVLRSVAETKRMFYQLTTVLAGYDDLLTCINVGDQASPYHYGSYRTLRKMSRERVHRIADAFGVARGDALAVYDSKGLAGIDELIGQQNN